MAEMLSVLHTAAFGWAMACCNRDRTLAEEVSQMAYMKILAGEARFDGRSSFKTWLFGVIRNTAAGERRKAWLTLSRLARFARLSPDPASTAEPETETAGPPVESRLLGVLARLSRRQREVLHLVFYQGLTLADAAEILGVTVGTARVHYDRGKKRLRALLSSEASR
jgi:RNA polymerase sigma-70 factor (ECF subfamily)